MFGTNPLRRQKLDSGNTLHVEDVWHTVQGEGPFAGVQAVFVRLSGCWLRCWFCDTEFEEGMKRDAVPVLDIERRVVSLTRKTEHKALTTLVVLTGGDPLLQNCWPLVNRLLGHDLHVQIETAGVQWVPGLEKFVDQSATFPTPRRLSIVCSPKTGRVAPEIVMHAAAWKYIISADDVLDPIDGLPNTSTQTKGINQKLARPPNGFPRGRVFLQPCDEYNDSKNDLNLQLVVSISKRYGYRISTQQHKLLGVE